MKNFSNYNDYSTKEELHFESKAVHGALGTEPLTGAVSMPIFQTATFRHPELGKSTGFAYSRLENPTRQELERTMAILEGGIKGFAFSSGQAANMAVFSLLNPGDHVSYLTIFMVEHSVSSVMFLENTESSILMWICRNLMR